MRHFLPTFAKLPERRFNRPTDAYDVMRVRDSWLCAQLADARSIQLREQIPTGWALPAHEAEKSWQKTFDLLMAKLGADSWGATCLFYTARMTS
jgi:hypothetical protein